MNKIHLTRIAFLAIIIAGFIFMPASASAQAVQTRETVPFTLVGGICSDLPSGLVVSGTADFLTVTVTRIDKDGGIHLIINTTANGTATDNEGGTYRLNFTRHASFDIASDQSSVETRTIIHSNLNGAGRADKSHFFVNLTGTYTDSGFELNSIKIRGDENCAP